MANLAERKFLFSIFIADEQKNLAKTFEELTLLFSENAKENAQGLFGPASQAQAAWPEQLALPQQIGLYHDSLNDRVIITGVANGAGLVEVTGEGQPQLVMDGPDNPRVLQFLIAVKDRLGIPGSMCTWIVAPLDELGSGFGTLHLKGMGGVSGSG
jgi:hypothetical protein